jgi:hypothetical protein
MPDSSASETALIVIAVAVSIQTLVTLGVVIGAVVAWRRMQATFEDRYEALAARVDEAVQPIRDAAEAVNRISDRASDAIGQAGRVAGAVSSFLTAPRNMAVMGAASVASMLLRWRRGRVRPAAQARPVRSPTAVH